MTSIAAADFGIIAMFDVSGQTVIRCEQRAAAGLVHLMQSHVAEGLGMALQCSQEDSDAWSLMAVAYRADATNSSVWRRSKLHVLEASVSFRFRSRCNEDWRLQFSGQLSTLCVSGLG